MNDFYVTLPSNVSSQVFKNNVQSDYTTLLSSPIELVGQYVVALAEIDYSNRIAVNMGSIFFPKFFDDIFQFNRVEMKPLELIFQNRINIKQFSEELCKKLEIYCQDFYKKNIENVVSQRIDDDLYSLIKQKDQSRDSFASHSIDVYCKDGKSYIMDFETSLYQHNYKQNGGVFNTTNRVWEFDHILSTTILGLSFNIFNFSTLPIDHIITVTYDQQENTIEFKNQKQCNIYWSGSLAYFFFGHNNYSSDLGIKIKIENQNFDFLKYACIYCDIIEDQYFGDKSTPILKMIVIDESNNSLIKSFDHLHYVNIRKSKIASINISLKDIAGENIKFMDDFAFVVVKLHFKKINNGLE